MAATWRASAPNRGAIRKPEIRQQVEGEEGRSPGLA